MINFFNDYTVDSGAALPDPQGPLEETSFLETAGSGLMKGAADIAGAATLATGGVVGLMEGGADIAGAADKVFRFYDDYIKPARDYWTPDPESVSEAGRFIGGVTGFLPYVALGPAAGPALIGASTFGTAADLVESGVDAETATGMGILSGATTGLMVGLPASGRTIKRTLAIAGANPIFGAAREGIQKEALEASGYEAQAAMFNPFDPVNRSLDLIMGGIFGGLSHYGTARKAMPVQFEDALDTAAHAQKVAKNNPLEGSRGAVAHDAALNKAITDVTEGRPVDVAEVVKDTPIKAEVPTEPEVAKVREAAESYGFGPFETVDDFYQALTKDVFDRNERGVGSVFSKEKQSWDDVLDAELEAEVGRRLEDYPDTVLHMGTDETGEAKIRPAVEVINEARAEIQRTESLSDLYNMAADCLRRG